MILWVDAQLSPALAPWIKNTFAIDAYSVKWLGYRDATDLQIFDAARVAEAVVMTKDNDFVMLLDKYGPPPQVLWVTIGNTSNDRMKTVLQQVLPRAIDLLTAGETLVELSDLLE